MAKISKKSKRIKFNKLLKKINKEYVKKHPKENEEWFN